MKRLVVLLLLCAPAVARADDPLKPVVPVASIVIPTAQPLVVFADGSVSKAPLSWQVIEPSGVLTRTEGSALIIPNPTPGQTYTLVLVATGDTVPAYAFRFAKVTAPGVVVPTPSPGPPAPPAPPAPAPDGTVGNMRALVLYESTDPMTAGQLYGVGSTAARAYLSAHCLKAVDGRPEWRFLDKDVDVSGESAEWRDAMAKAKADPTPLPKVVIFGGNTLVEAKPIADEASLLAYLKTKGGN